MVKKDEDGTTSGAKKIPLILKDFFSIKPVDNHISMTYNIKSHEDGLRAFSTACILNPSVNF
jgi:hypothetical protein